MSRPRCASFSLDAYVVVQIQDKHDNLMAQTEDDMPVEACANEQGYIQAAVGTIQEVGSEDQLRLKPQGSAREPLRRPRNSRWSSSLVTKLVEGVGLGYSCNIGSVRCSSRFVALHRSDKGAAQRHPHSHSHLCTTAADRTRRL